jgi:hypothetical protein
VTVVGARKIVSQIRQGSVYEVEGRAAGIITKGGAGRRGGRGDGWGLLWWKM